MPGKRLRAATNALNPRTLGIALVESYRHVLAHIQERLVIALEAALVHGEHQAFSEGLVDLPDRWTHDAVDHAAVHRAAVDDVAVAPCIRLEVIEDQRRAIASTSIHRPNVEVVVGTGRVRLDDERADALWVDVLGVADILYRQRADQIAAPP